MSTVEPRPIGRGRTGVDRPRPIGRGPDSGGPDAGGTDVDGPDVGGPYTYTAQQNSNSNWPGLDDPRESALTPYLPERWRGARLELGRGGMSALCAVGVVVVIVAGFALLRDSPTVAPVPALPVVAPVSDDHPESEETPKQGGLSGTPDSVEQPPFIVVSVVGLVASSGLVHLPPDSRIADALAAAGGPLPNADVLTLNLAAKLQDGDQIVVGTAPAEGRTVISGTVSGSGAPGSGTSGTGKSGTGTSGAGVPAAGQGNAGGSTGALNLNTATVAELDTLSGVGPVTAANIVAWRDTNGPFTDVSQLAEVTGIGPVRLENLRSQVTV